MAQKNILAIIPARGGSKGIPRKNLAPLKGAPLIAYSIRAALAVPSITRVCVSTDDPEIAEVSERWGAEVPFLRPPHLGTDAASLVDVLQHFVDELARREGERMDRIVTLYPTQPFRSVATVDYLCGRLLQGSSSIRTVSPVKISSSSFFANGNGLSARPLFASPKECEYTYYRSSGYLSGWVWGKDWDTPSVHCIDDPIALLDIDEPSDLHFARRIVDEGLFVPEWSMDQKQHI